MTRTTHPPRSALRRLARLYGVQTSYRDADGARIAVRDEALAAVLRVLDAPLGTGPEADGALRERRLRGWCRAVPPVSVVWHGEPARIDLSLPADRSDRRVDCALHLEDGEVRRWRALPTDLRAVDGAEIEGVRFARYELPLPDPLPWGYHRLRVEPEGGEGGVIVAPGRAYGGDRAGAGDRAWGLFLPLHALRTGSGWGVGDATDLGEFARWTAERGGDFVATLPLLPTFIGDASAVPFEPSPYSPITRLFWSELYADVMRAPELSRCPSAQMLVNSTALQNAVDRLRREPYVDYAAALRIKRQVLEALADSCFDASSDRLDELRRFTARRPRLERYARFRATLDRRREPWRAWPEPLRSGRIDAADRDARAERYHLYTQWLMDRQLGSVVHARDLDGAGLYLDFPLGVHPDGFDVWSEPDLFARGASAGAPPDPFSAAGQNWGCPPPRPDAMREQQYRYTIACLRHHMRCASVLRIDHVMGLHRVFWVPSGFDAADGAYVRYPADELYAILCLESHRHRTLVVGEDLGTVPGEVRRAMTRRGLHGTYALPFELGPDRTPRRPRRRSVAVLGTHDMPSFAAFWQGRDIRDRREAGLVDPDDARREAAERERVRDALIRFLRERGRLGDDEDSTRAVLRACLAWLAAGPARIVVVDLEDLWLETEPQNVPGTVTERPNWRRKARYRLEELDRRPAVLRLLETIDRLRGQGGDAR